MRRIVLCLLAAVLAAAQAAAVEVRLRDGTVLEATGYTLTGSYLMLTLADGGQVAYDVADVDLESLRAQQPEPEQPEAAPEPVGLSQGRRELSLPPEGAAGGGLTITDQDVEHIKKSEPEAAGDEGEPAAAGATEGLQTGGQVVVDKLRVTAQGENEWLVEGEVINRRSQPVLNVRVQLQTLAGPGETPWSGEVEVSAQLPPGGKGVFSRGFEAPKPKDKVNPEVRASVFWMEHKPAPEKPPAAVAAPRMPGGGAQVDY